MSCSMPTEINRKQQQQQQIIIDNNIATLRRTHPASRLLGGGVRNDFTRPSFSPDRWFSSLDPDNVVHPRRPADFAHRLVVRDGLHGVNVRAPVALPRALPLPRPVAVIRLGRGVQRRGLVVVRRHLRLRHLPAVGHEALDEVPVALLDQVILQLPRRLGRVRPLHQVLRHATLLHPLQQRLRQRVREALCAPRLGQHRASRAARRRRRPRRGHRLLGQRKRRRRGDGGGDEGRGCNRGGGSGGGRLVAAAVLALRGLVVGGPRAAALTVVVQKHEGGGVADVGADVRDEGETVVAVAECVVAGDGCRERHDTPQVLCGPGLRRRDSRHRRV
eukprot:Rhum_TRINITY_DN16575_c0_g1::Rhum_TRINITY_DN16575_c0_g1_i1::g.163705::m.163705